MVSPSGTAQRQKATPKDVLIDFLAGGTGLSVFLFI
jgi:hypothetical protein